jgi:alginate O-acetyltransferase complex protein AlgJ
MNKFATVTRLAPNGEKIEAWALDSPAYGKIANITERGLYIQGWILGKTDVAVGSVILRSMQDTVENHRTIPLNSGRPDVIQRVLGLASLGHVQLRCGYSTYLSNFPEEFTLGAQINGEIAWFCRVELHERDELGAEKVDPGEQMTQQPVIFGTNDWLFLDNDTNRSVDQYTGRLMLDEGGLSQWRSYLNQCASLALEAGSRHAIVISPSKEQVLPEHYPHQKGELTVSDQVFAICRGVDHVIDAASLLAARPEKQAYLIKTDTHWTDRGALLATEALIGELGLDFTEANRLFADDLYHTMPFAGDLGIKLTPALAAPTEFLVAPPPPSGAIFDNHLPNIGRVLVFESDVALWPNSMLIFGSSSSYPMLKYLKRLFSRIVFTHSAGNVDAEILSHEKPDFLVMQTTGRFMVEPPNVNFSLGTAVKRKLAAEPEAVRARGHALVAKQPEHEMNRPYYQMLGAQP